ncbi:hypothetical protein [Priestia flexa]|uniref:hypothetical protein n=1 Tax=Priestia flexa TaxID=86664 RepID=UPI001B33A6E1|nr:hypothetical protein [Priestia flexa]MDT2046527.1 hypothetical protein [Priestia flexa]
MKENLLESIYKQGYPDAQTAPLVSLEEFFEGNEDEGSIGCNLIDHPGVSFFYEVLLEIRNKENVQDVFVEIMEVEDEEYWPFSERIYVLTDAKVAEVKQWMSILEPDEIDEGYAFGKPSAAPELKLGYHVIGAWWD